MSRPSSRYLRVFAGVCVLCWISFVAIPFAQARDGRSRTPASPFEELPGPSSPVHAGVIVAISPLCPGAGPSRSGAAAPDALAHPPSGKVAGFMNRPRPLFDARSQEAPSVKETAKAVEGAAMPGAAQTASSSASGDANSTGEGFDNEVRRSPTLGNESSAVLTSPVSPFLNRFALDASSVEMLEVELAHVFDGLAASLRDEWARPLDPLLAGSTAPKLGGSEVDASRSPFQTPSQAAPGELQAEPTASPNDMISRTLALTASASAVRAAKRANAVTALAKDMQQLADWAHPIEFSPAAAPERAPSLTSSVVERSQKSPTGFSWLLSKETAVALTAARTVASNAGSDSSLGDDGQNAPGVEQPQKRRRWLDLVKAQAAISAVAREDGQQEQTSAGPFKFLRSIKNLIGSQPATPEERAYASLLEEGVRGPRRLRIADRSTLWLPAGYVFLDAEKAVDLMSGEEGALDEASLGLILPSTGTPTWMAYIDLIEHGYIKDGDAKALGAKERLSALVAASGTGARNGLTVGEWITPPKYSAATHILSSCVSVRDGANPNVEARLVNCASFALGRRGAVKVLVAGEISNLPSFANEAAMLAEKITYDPDARYEGFVPDEDQSADYGLLALAGGAVGLKNILALVAAAGAGKAQTLLLSTIISYWEAILTALIAGALGIRWFLASRPQKEQEGDAPRNAIRPPLWKAALWAVRSGLRCLFERRAAPTRFVEARAEKVGNEPNSPPTRARTVGGFAIWRRRLSFNFGFPRRDSKARLEAEPSLREGEIEKRDGKQAEMAAGQAPTSGSLLGLGPGQEGAAPSQSREDSFSRTSAPPERLADAIATNAGNLNRLASVMRSKAETVTSKPGASEPPRARSAGAPNAAASTKIEDPTGVDAGPAALALFDLVEPGDAEAVSMAVSAHEAVQKAHG